MLNIHSVSVTAVGHTETEKSVKVDNNKTYLSIFFIGNKCDIFNQII
jgi:hypothetical protein